MRFTKVKYDGVHVQLEWEEENGPGGDQHEHRFKSDDPPAQELVDAFDAFKPEVLKLLELPKDYGGDKLTVRGVSLNYESDDRMGAVVTCLRELADANAPLVLNTPHLREPDIDDPGPSLSDAMITAIDTLKREAKRYVNGHREQRDMFEGADGDGQDAEVGERPHDALGEQVAGELDRRGVLAGA